MNKYNYVIFGKNKMDSILLIEINEDDRLTEEELIGIKAPRIEEIFTQSFFDMYNRAKKDLLGKTGLIEFEGFYFSTFFEHRTPENGILIHLDKNWGIDSVSEINGPEKVLYSFFCNGLFHSKISYINNKMHGRIICYHNNGSLHCRGIKLNNSSEGQYRSYHYHGILMEECFYENGEIQGEWKRYSNKGKIREKRFYKGGEMEGIVYLYYSNGNIESESFYDKENNEIRSINNDKTGNFINIETRKMDDP